MEDVYKKLYFQLFNQISTVIEELQQIQVVSEEAFIQLTEEERSGN